MSSYCYICVLRLLHMCPHADIYVSSCYYMCALSSIRWMASFDAVGKEKKKVHADARLSRSHTCPHTTIYVSAYYYICVLSVRILICMCPHKLRAGAKRSSTHLCPRTAIGACRRGLQQSAHTAIYIRVLILLYVSPYCYRCLRTRGSSSPTCPHTYD